MTLQGRQATTPPAPEDDAAPDVFKELDTLLAEATAAAVNGSGALNVSRHTDHGSRLVAQMTEIMDGAAKCRDRAVILTQPDEDEVSAGLTKPQESDGPQLFAELDGLLVESGGDSAIGRGQPPSPHAMRLAPCKKDLEALLKKVTSDSSILAAQHPVIAAEEQSEISHTDRGLDPALLGGSATEDPAVQSRDLDPSLLGGGATEEDSKTKGSEPMFFELSSLLQQDRDGKFMQDASSLAQQMNGFLNHARQCREETTMLADRVLRGEDFNDDRPADMEWRRSTLQSLPRSKGPSPIATGGMATRSGKGAISGLKRSSSAAAALKTQGRSPAASQMRRSLAAR